MWMLVFWVLTPCGLVGKCQRLGGSNTSSHFQEQVHTASQPSTPTPMFCNEFYGAQLYLKHYKYYSHILFCHGDPWNSACFGVSVSFFRCLWRLTSACPTSGWTTSSVYSLMQDHCGVNPSSVNRPMLHRSNTSICSIFICGFTKQVLPIRNHEHKPTVTEIKFSK
jgi:hypothetical protein